MKNIILDSRLAVNGDTSQPLWRFSNGVRIHAVRLNTAIVPLSFLNVHSDNNVIRFSNRGTERTAILKLGQYTGVELADEVARSLTQYDSQTYTVNCDHVSGKVTVSAPSTFRFIGANTTASKILGYKGSDTSPATTYTFGNPIDLTGTQLILVSSQDLSAKGNIMYAGREILNILDCIPVTQDLGTVQHHQFNISDYIDVSDQVISELSIRLLDSTTLKPLDLRGESFQLVFDVI